MPVNKNAIKRYQALDKCFRNPGRKYDINSLVEYCNIALKDINPKSSGVKRRQVYDDIKFMKDSIGYDAPIETKKEGRRAYYYYSDRNFTINKQPLNEFEAQQLKEALITLSRFKGLPQFEWAEEMNLRLEQSFNLGRIENVISFDNNPYLTGRNYIGDIYNSIINKTVLEVDYESFKVKGKHKIIFHPYHLKQYNNRWFVFGLNNEFQIIWNLPLDRIRGIKSLTIPFLENTQIDFSEYFEDVIGVTIIEENHNEKIVIRIEKDEWPYIQTKPIHGSQKKIHVDESFVYIQLDVKINYELVSELLSYGPKLKVIEPETFVMKIKSTIANMEKIYK